MSAPSFHKFVKARPWLHKIILPIGRWHCRNAGYRELGLKGDDLIPEENDIVQLALKRLPPKEAYDRIFRIRRAFQCSLTHQLLPREEWTQEREDRHYLTPIIEEIEEEIREREDLDAMVVKKKK